MYGLILSVIKLVGETLIAFRETNAAALRNAAFDLRAGGMTAVAGDLDFIAPGILAEVAAEFLAGLYIAITGFVGALMLFHVRLLPS